MGPLTYEEMVKENETEKTEMSSVCRNRDIEKEEVSQSCGKIGAAKSEPQLSRRRKENPLSSKSDLGLGRDM